MADIENLQTRMDDLLSGRGKGSQFVGDAAAADTTPQEWYSEFFSPDRGRAVELASQAMRVADEKGGEEGLADAVTELEHARDAEKMPRLVQHAAELFLTHHSEARDKLRLRPLEKRQPDLVRSSKVSRSDHSDATTRGRQED